MKSLFEFLSTKVKLQHIIHATDDTIHKIVKDELDRLGNDADLNYIDVSEVTNMDSLFSCHKSHLGPKYENLNPNISQWDVRNVKSMKEMFYGCHRFNQDISQWKVGKVENMFCMFYGCSAFDKDISQWKVGKVENMRSMFLGCHYFNCDIGGWDVSRVEDMSNMFYCCDCFNQDLSKWNVKKVKNMDYMFLSCPIKEKFKPKFK